jgi:Fe(3+) dicitrate transport protein
LRITELTVVGTKEKQTAGSAHIVKAEELERSNQDDVTQVLKQVPGVYSRGEDGFGLRPNIGIRGVSPDRSKKVTLMEDGILFGPAPYTAPAAYFFPLMTRMEGMGVIKGPGSVSFGPQTVGGAVDLITRRVPPRLSGGVDLAGGQYQYGKAHGYLGASSRHFGLLLEGVHLRTDGFKQLDGGGDTGFRKNEAMGKLRYIPAPGASVYNEIELKLGLSTEDSQESYLGLSDADFRTNPLRRYAASKLDHMEWWRTQAVLKHVIDFGGGSNIETAIYRHDFDRTWRKVNAVKLLPARLDIFEVLRNPTVGRNPFAVQALQLDPTTDPTARVVIGPNHREFVSQGVTSRAQFNLGEGSVTQRLELGVRLHQDSIARDHNEDDFAVENGQLAVVPGSNVITADDDDSALALALHALDAVTWRRLTLTPGLRFELIRTNGKDNLKVIQNSDWHPVLIPGAGAYFAVTEVVGVLGGVYRGFSPPAPDATQAADPELSWNYELGVRASGRNGRAEAIGFYNDYSNLVSQCNVTCGVELADRQFNAGDARVWGFELFAQNGWRPFPGISLPITGSYTFTHGTLQSTFTSPDPTLGQVFAGDDIPYVPRHQAGLTLAAELRHFGVHLATTYSSGVREEAFGGDPPPGAPARQPAQKTDDSLVFEAGARVYLPASSQLYLLWRNFTNQADIAARRPYGARPIAPRWLQVGLKASF